MNQDRRFSVQAAADANYLDISPEEPARLDPIALRMLQEDKPEFFLPVQVRTMNDRLSLRYRLQNAVSLSNSIGGALTKREFVELALSLLTPFMKCRDWFLDYHYICVNPQFILHDRHSGGYLFVYVPEQSFYNDDREIISFFESVLNYIDISDDREYQIEIMHYFRGGNVTLSEMWQMFTNEREKSSMVAPKPKVEERNYTANSIPTGGSYVNSPAVNTERVDEKPAPVETPKPAANTGSAKPSFFDKLIGKKKPESEPVESKPTAPKAADNNDDGDDMIEELFGGKKSKSKPQKNLKPEKNEPLKKGGFFKSAAANEPKPEPKPAPKPVEPVQPSFEPQPSFGFGESESDETSIGDADIERSYLELIDSRFDNVPQHISLEFDKPFVTLGRRTPDGPQPDIAFPEHCRGISRQHARITNKDGALEIIDLGSTYHTLLDGQRLVPNMSYPLKNGMILTIVEDKPVRYRVHTSANS